MATEDNYPLVDNAIDAINASLWLIAGDKLEQAIIVLHNSIELLLKAELARIHPVLIADNRRLDYVTLKSILKDDIERHHRGRRLNIPVFSIDRTITFLDTVDRVEEFYPGVISKWRRGLERLNHTRNQLIHSGPQESERANHIEIVSTVVFQFLEEFLTASRDRKLERIVSTNTYRELHVAKTLFERLKSNNHSKFGYVLKTLSLSVLYNNVTWPKLDGGHLGMSEGDESLILSEWEERNLDFEWGNAKRGLTTCRICSSYTAFVKLRTRESPHFDEIPSAVRCSNCGLDILESDVHLAEIHVGEDAELDF